MAEMNPKDGFFSMGEHTYKVPMALFKKNRDRLVQALKVRFSPLLNSIELLIILTIYISA